jgi:aspartate/methionine/tyrosine aminotransferase
MALVNPGDEVIYPNPGFPIYESMINYVGGVPVPLRLREENQFRADVAELRSKITDRTKLMILNTPQNPTGSVLTKADVEGIAEIVEGRDLMVLCDEVYCQILYEGKFESLASLPGMKEKVILLDGFSKTYAMTGWRLGYAAARKDLVAYISKLMVNSVSCTASFVQMAGAAALNGPQESVGLMVSEFKQRRDLIVAGLNALPGVTCVKPAGAFYVFPNITGTGMSSQELADLMLYEGGVALLAGTCFGAYGEGYLRLSYANSQENIRQALTRMKTTLEKHAGK